MSAKKTIYYRDELNDDFAGNGINTKRVEADFPFRREGLLWRACAFVAYYFIALPLVWLAAKVYLGLKIKNRRALKTIGKQGFFLYGNHTRDLDAFVPALIAFPRRAVIITHPDAVSIPGLRLFVQMLGALPLPSDFSGMMNFLSALFAFVKDGRCVTVYPEAHVWPFYTGIRPFRADSFCYPVRSASPVVAMVTTYRKRKGLFALCKKPAMTVTLSEPFYPDRSKGVRAAGEELRDKAYRFMLDHAQNDENVEYIHYEKIG